MECLLLEAAPHRWCARRPAVPLRKDAAGTGLQVPLELHCSLLVRKFDGDVQLPGTVPRSVGAAAGIVIGEAGADVRGVTDVERWLRISTLENVDESVGFGHARPEATPMPIADTSKHAACARWPSEGSQFLRLGHRNMVEDSRSGVVRVLTRQPIGSSRDQCIPRAQPMSFRLPSATRPRVRGRWHGWS